MRRAGGGTTVPCGLLHGVSRQVVVARRHYFLLRVILTPGLVLHHQRDGRVPLMVVDDVPAELSHLAGDLVANQRVAICRPVHHAVPITVRIKCPAPTYL